MAADLGLPEGFTLDDPGLPQGFELDPHPDTYNDIVKSGASGVAKGVVGLPGLPGDVRQLAKAAPWAPKRSLMDLIEEKVGKLPTSAELQQKAGLTYQPQTTAGKYAERIGEFAPGALIGGEGPAAARLLTGAAVPGAASQAGEDLTKGTALEPYGGLVGGVVGGAAGTAMPNVAGAFARKIRAPITPRPDVEGNLAVLEQHNIPLTAGQQTGSKQLQWLEDAAQKLPGGPEKMEPQRQAFNRAVTAQTGYPSDMLTTDWHQNTANALGKEYDALVHPQVAQIDPQLHSDMMAAIVRYGMFKEPTMQKPGLPQVAAGLMEPHPMLGNAVPGDMWQSKRSDLRVWRDAQPIGSPERELAQNTIDAWQNMMARSMSPEDQAALSDLDRRYAAFKTIQNASSGAGQAIAEGYISPAKLRQSVASTKVGKINYTRAGTELAKLGRAGEAYMKPLPSSGTAERGMALKLLGGAGAGAALGHLPATVASYLASLGAAHGLMSQPVQRYLKGAHALPAGPMATPSLQDYLRGAAFGGLLGTQ